MRFTIVGIEGSYDSTRYYLRYFQYQGKGMVADESGQSFIPNDLYEMVGRQFRLYFTPTAGSEHQLELTFIDSYKHKHALELSFAIEEDSGE